MYKNNYQRKRRFLANNNTSGLNGVSFNKAAGKWEAYIFVNKSRKFLGHFATKEEAAQARIAAGGAVYLQKMSYRPPMTSRLGMTGYNKEKAESEWGA